MNMQAFYKVGGHCYRVDFRDERNSVALLASSEPFKIAEEEKEGVLFDLVVDDRWRPQHKGKEIGKFDCGGNNHYVYVQDDGSYQILVCDMEERHCCLMQALPDFSSATVCLNGDERMRVFGLNNALMMMYAFAGADKMTVLMHASVMRKDGKGYLCLGVSGTGKSTHTSNWLRYIPDTELINDDNPVVRVCADGVVRVYGSPWSGKTPCYKNVNAIVAGFLQLKQAPHNRIERMNVVDAFASLLPSCSVMKWDRRDYVGVCDTVGKVLERVPVFFLENLPDEDACRLSFTTLSGIK
jgi:hypothetical protein